MRSFIRNFLQSLRFALAGFLIREGYPKFMREMKEGEDIGNLYMTIGHVITTWAHVETEVIRVAAIVMRAEPNYVGTLLYSMSFNSWLTSTTDLMLLNTSITKDSRKAWTNTHNELRRLKDIRDRIAHNPIEHSSRFTRIGRSQLDMRTKTLKLSAVSSVELEAAAKDMSKIMWRLLDVSDLVIKDVIAAASLKKPPLQTTDQPLPQDQQPSDQQPPPPHSPSPP